jgi:hypothetical protein
MGRQVTCGAGETSFALAGAGIAAFRDITFLAAASVIGPVIQQRSHLLMPFVMCAIKGPFDAQRIACRELIPLMASGTGRCVTPETPV